MPNSLSRSRPTAQPKSATIVKRRPASVRDVAQQRRQKSLAPDAQARLREALARLETELGTGVAVAKLLGISQGYVTELRKGTRGGGMKLLQTLIAKRPDLAAYVLGTEAPAIDARLVTLAKRLALDPDVLVPLWELPGAEDVLDEVGVPEYVRRAAMATVYLDGVTIEAAYSAAVTAWLRHRDDQTMGQRPRAWLDEIRDALPRHEETGIQPVVTQNSRK